MKRRASTPDRAALAAEIAGLPELPTKELSERWKSLYGRAPSVHVGRTILIHSIAYRLQEKAFGGLKPSTRRLLARVADEARTGGTPAKPKGRTANAHRVTVLDEGVAFNGKRYRSLSEVAREITGSRWSGPRFFGLRPAQMENNNGTA